VILPQENGAWRVAEQFFGEDWTLLDMLFEAIEHAQQYADDAIAEFERSIEAVE
jgi:hypothetical protein